mgnify:CR=1 FL=1
MSIQFRVLGAPFLDNALYMEVHPGQQVYRLLFDCGAGCLDDIKPSKIMAVDHLCFSHFHLDHIAGFDRFLRFNYRRENKPVRVWGPESAVEIIGHRLQGVTWDRVENEPGEWLVTSLGKADKETVKFVTREQFRLPHPVEKSSFTGTLFSNGNIEVRAVRLQHRTPSMAYIVKEQPQVNIDREELATLKIPPGPWLNRLKDFDTFGDSDTLEIGGSRYAVQNLREKLLVQTPGESLAYVTDCLFEPSGTEALVREIRGVTTLVCEATYADEDIELARENYHLTASQAAQIAANANAEQLILLHISDRYQSQGIAHILNQAREVFPETYLPDTW